MTSTTINASNGSLIIGPVGTPIFHKNQQILRGFVESASSETAWKPGDEVALRAPVLKDGWSDTQREERRALQAKEIAAIQLLHPELNAQLVTIEIEGVGEEQVIVHRWIKGDTLERTIQGKYPKGAPLDLGLKWARQIASDLAKLHEARLVHRNANPSHILIDDQQNARVIGFAAIADRQARPTQLFLSVDDRWSAPEIQRELSGTFITPKADIYTFGGVLAFIFSGEPLTDSVEAPVSFDAWGKLGELPEGIRLLVGHCMQPFHKNRLVNAGTLLEYLEEDSLPTKYSKNFGAISLLAPWTQTEGEKPTSSLTPGPLVSRSFDPSALVQSVEAAKAAAATEPKDRLPSAANSETTEDDNLVSSQLPPILSAPANGSDAQSEKIEITPFWEKPEPAADGKPIEVLPSDAPFFARRGISPFAIIVITICIIAMISAISQLYQ